MHTDSEPTGAPQRPEDVLPDQDDHARINGVSVRKGTVAAFLRNATRWCDPLTANGDRGALAREMAASVPALHALGVFAVFEARDERLRAFLAGCPAHHGS